MEGWVELEFEELDESEEMDELELEESKLELDLEEMGLDDLELELEALKGLEGLEGLELEELAVDPAKVASSSHFGGRPHESSYRLPLWGPTPRNTDKNQRPRMRNQQPRPPIGVPKWQTVATLEPDPAKH